MITRSTTTTETNATQTALTLTRLHRQAMSLTDSGYSAWTQHMGSEYFDNFQRWSGRDYRHQIEQASREVAVA